MTSRGLKEVQNEYILRLICSQRVVPDPGSRPRCQCDREAVAPARGPAVRSISTRAALHAWPRSEMASEARAGRKLTAWIGQNGFTSDRHPQLFADFKPRGKVLMDATIARLNIEHFRKLLLKELNPIQRQTRSPTPKPTQVTLHKGVFGDIA